MPNGQKYEDWLKDKEGHVEDGEKSDQDSYEEARALYVRALAIHEEALGEEHPDTKLVWPNLTMLDTQQKK